MRSRELARAIIFGGEGRHMGMTIPRDLALWLDADSRDRLESLPRGERRRYLDRIQQAREPDMRERRIALTVQILRTGRTR